MHTTTVTPALKPVSFDTATDRSVQASRRVAKRDLEAQVHQVPDVVDLDALAVSCRLNERQSTVRGKLGWPDRAMRDLVSSL